MDFVVKLMQSNAPYIVGSGRSANGDGLLEENSREYAGGSHLDTSRLLASFLEHAKQLSVAIEGEQTAPVRLVCASDGHKLSCKKP